MSRPTDKTRVFLARRFTPAVERTLRERYEVIQNERDDPMDADRLAAAAAGCAYLFVTVTESVSAKTIERLLPTLKVIGTHSVGFNHIDLDAARRAGIAVMYTPDVLSEACAEVALMLILNASRRAREADLMLRSGAWEGWAPTQLMGLGLVGRRLGILGLGRIGRQVAARAAGFGLSIHYHNRNRLPEAEESGAIYHEHVDDFLRHSDILCICAPAVAELRGFVNAERIALLPKDAIVVNVSRGDLVDDDALIEALKTGRLYAAGLDVFNNEPKLDPRYLDLPNAILLPHIASATTQARDAMGFLLVNGVRAFEEGKFSANRLF